MMMSIKVKPKRDPMKFCINCGGEMQQDAIRYELRPKAAIVFLSCTACKHNLTAFRKMTAKELEAETERARREAERIEAENQAKAERRRLGY